MAAPSTFIPDKAPKSFVPDAPRTFVADSITGPAEFDLSVREAPDLQTTTRGGPRVALPDFEVARSSFRESVQKGFGDVVSQPGIELPSIAPSEKTMQSALEAVSLGYGGQVKALPGEELKRTTEIGSPAKAVTGAVEGVEELVKGVVGFFTSGPGMLQLGAAATPIAPAVYLKWTVDMLNAGFTSAEEAWDAFQKSDWKNASKNTAIAFGSFLGAGAAAKHGYKKLEPLLEVAPRGDLRGVRVEEAQRKALEATMPLQAKVEAEVLRQADAPATAAVVEQIAKEAPTPKGETPVVKESLPTEPYDPFKEAERLNKLALADEKNKPTQKPKTIGPVADVLRRYDESDPNISTPRDVANAVQELIDSGDAPKSLQKHIDKLNKEVAGSREFGNRMDMEGEAGDALISALEKYAKKETRNPTPDLTRSGEKGQGGGVKLTTEQEKNLAVNIKRFGWKPEDYGMTPERVAELTPESPKKPVEEKGFKGGEVVRYTTKSGKGLLNKEALDFNKLTEAEAQELSELMNYGLQQPLEVPAGASFYFTKAGEKKNARLIKLLTKASKEPVVRTVREKYEKPVWESGDGQIAFENRKITTENETKTKTKEEAESQAESSVGGVGKQAPRKADSEQGLVQGSEPSPPTPKPIGLGGAIPEEFKPSQSLPTANKNAAIDADRVARGEAPLMSAMRKSDPELWDQAMRIIEEDWQAADKLIARHKAEPFTPTDTDIVVLLQRRTDLKNTFANLSREYARAMEEGRPEAAESAKVSRDLILDQLRELESVVGRGDTGMGTMQGRAFRARRLAMNEDYSLASLIVDREADLKRKLNPEEIAELEKISQDQARVSAELAKKEADLEARAQEIEAKEIAARAAADATADAPSPYVVKLVESIVKDWDARADRARARLKERMSRMSSGVDPTILVDLAEVGLSHLGHAGLNFTKWSARMVADVGDWAKPHLEEVFKRSQKLAESDVEKRAGPKKAEVKKAIAQPTPVEAIDNLVTRVGRRFAKNPQLDFSHAARKIARYYVEQGITKPLELVDAVHAKLVEAMPELTKRETMDALSGYGRFTPLKKDAVSVALRDATGQMQQIAKLEDMAAGQAPLKTGPERRVPSDEERRYIKQVEEAKRRGGYNVTDPSTQLRTKLQAAKTAIRNLISDLSFEIAKRERILKVKTPMVPDAELLALRAQRDALRKEEREIFGDRVISNARKLELAEKALDRQIKEIQRQLQSGEIFPPGKPEKSTLTSLSIEAKAQELAELKLRRYYERQAAQPSPDMDVREANKLRAEMKAAKIRIKKQMDDIANAIATRTALIKNKRKRDVDDELRTLREQRDFLNEVYDEVFPEAPLTEPQRLAKWKELVRERIEIKMEQRRNRDFKPRQRPEQPRLDKEAIKLRYDLHKVHNALMDMRLRDELKNQTRAKKLVGAAANVYRFSRAVKTTGEFSAVLRQGGPIFLSRPSIIAKNLKPMFEALMSEQAQFRRMEEIMTRDNATLYERSGLQFTEAGVRLSTMEEYYMFRVSEKMGKHPLTKYPIKYVNAFQRAFTTFINGARADAFDVLLDINGDSPVMQKQIANLINVATGRGSKTVGRYTGVGANTVFFAPRHSISRFQMLVGQPFWYGNLETRKMVAREYGRALVGVGVIYALGSAAGGDIETDPRHPDFGKIKFGNTRIDPLFGLVQATRFLAQEISGTRINKKDQVRPLREGFRMGGLLPKRRLTEPSGLEVAGRFGLSKLAPGPAIGSEFLSGEQFGGNKFSLSDAFLGSFVPITYGDILAVMQEQGMERGAAMAVLAMFGMGVQTYDANAKREE